MGGDTYTCHHIQNNMAANAVYRKFKKMGLIPRRRKKGTRYYNIFY